MANVDAITTGLSLGHTQFVGDLGYGATGSELYILNNDKLSALAPTALDKLNYLVVTGNAKLLAFNFSSYTNLKDDASPITVTITSNGGTALGTASYSPAVVVTGSTPYQEAVIKSNSILTLKAYMAMQQAAGRTPMMGTNIDINLNAAATTLSSKMIPNSLLSFPGLEAASVIVDNVGAITTYAEMGLVVAE
jgi:hypothetical protein